MNINLNHGEINKRIGKAIAKQRQQSGYTQEQVAEMLEIGNEAVSRMERGLIMPNVVRLIELAEKDRQLMLDFLDSFARRLKQE
ncbi:helix-turn-helix domain-containing protein [Aggregatibacter actinomycetemcomitans]|uniref:helix-turn-helix domain-containing protein n=1 Tax=Aggregatibacter actinomycetemcomitans TaxID=714 RepID=UPI00022AC59F|nr:helix-turn-helix transcriptional regulator [Aggregatibacter actinomycetemcomitans]AEW76201.1 helix-turn-helix domain-containing protein [Aggregatibacter actinomycetemcomitans ANH9381]ACX83333.2 transcriptional regulator [Aggregatibacter actinomycetemcomitans D11S-1]AMQ92282.1 transcriptional regulator [Aggregatibacter actinomycetemcomitans]KND84290.1 transcriptional regulator [Aggregatibacter actinomycetemcomitans serotype b str. SCC1398]KOE52283.1 transcriptional regulator [Aggregatibacter